MPRSTRRLLLVIALVAASMPAAATADSKTTAGALTMNARLLLHHRPPGIDPGPCPQADDCNARIVRGPFPGLGQVDGRYVALFDQCPGHNQGRLLGYPIRLPVAGKGEIHVAVAESPCGGFEEVADQTQTFTVTGGTGSYAGASGSGTLAHNLGPLGPRGRIGTETWTGTLEVPGLEFDLARPTLTGASNKTVKARKGAKSARVLFRVTALDDRDGALPVSCYPRSGSAFPIGRTRVNCQVTDTSANTAKASLTVTVQRRR